MGSLDINEPQFIRHFPGDQHVTWHHRVALKKVGPGKRICLTPDLEFEFVNLHETEHKFVARSCPFPRDHENDTYTFGPISQAEIARFKKGASQWGVCWRRKVMM